MLIAPIWVLGQHLPDCVWKDDRCAVQVVADGGRGFVEDGVGGLDGGIFQEGLDTGEYLVEHYAEGEDIGSRIDFLPP